MPTLDVTKLATPALKAMLTVQLKVHGIKADIYKLKQVSNSDYQEVYPELIESGNFLKSTFILASETLIGQSLSDFVSLIGNTDEDKWIICLDTLEEGQKVEVFYPDGKNITLRVVGNHGFQRGSSFQYKYYVRVM